MMDRLIAGGQCTANKFMAALFRESSDPEGGGLSEADILRNIFAFNFAGYGIA